MTRGSLYLHRTHLRGLAPTLDAFMLHRSYRWSIAHSLLAIRILAGESRWKESLDAVQKAQLVAAGSNDMYLMVCDREHDAYDAQDWGSMLAKMDYRPLRDRPILRTVG